jgi:hypothetical protein
MALVQPSPTFCATGAKTSGCVGEAGVLAQDADAMAHVAAEGLEPGARPHGAHLLLPLLDAAQLEAGGPPCGGRRHALPHLLLGQQLAERARLVGKLLLGARALQEVALEAAKPRQPGHRGPPIDRR